MNSEDAQADRSSVTPTRQDDSTDDRYARPRNAVDARFTLAAERTVLAWIRTALGLVAAGVAVLHVVDAFPESGPREAVGIVLIATGALAAVLGAWRWHRTDVALRRGDSMPGGGAVWFLVVVIVVLSIVFVVASLISD
ncbi:YidH family protein [Williamsia sterculiae]|uniref:YidH family protein n=1 Tax=Williamsia sterculiae TaxID=1344003 RepID=UPI001F3B0C42|nr:DUF202 domain-containing protein [Williamsia sterculiae]